MAAISTAGLASAETTGTATISATLGSVVDGTGLTVVAGPLAITSLPPPAGTVNQPYMANLTAVGGQPPYLWTVVSGTLPDGLTLSPGVGIGGITGTPPTVGTSNFVIQVSDSAGDSVTQAMSITVNTAAVSIWPSDPTPSIVDGGDTGSVELGVKFRSDTGGTITGIRFYKAATNTGTHVGNLWSVGGTRLGTATFSNETASGWQQVNFSPPVAIQANTVYVASYFAPEGHYSGDLNYFASQGVDTRPLHALATGVAGGDGVYGYGATSSFPTNTFKALNYWVDVLFTPEDVPTLTSIAVTPADATLTVGRDPAVHRHGHLLGFEHAGPDQSGDVRVLGHGDGDDQPSGAGDGGRRRDHHHLGHARVRERKHRPHRVARTAHDHDHVAA